MRFLTSGLVLAFFTALMFSTLLSCSLEEFDACDQEGMMECDSQKGEQTYRKCSNARWVEDKCPAQTFCQSDACVECTDEMSECSEIYLKTLRVCRLGQWFNEECLGDLECKMGKCVDAIAACTQDTMECIDMHSARICVSGERPALLTCGDNKHCENGECVASPILCAETSTTCFDKETLQLCAPGQKAVFTACHAFDVCDAGKCVKNPLLCEKSQDICLDQQMLEHCVLNQPPVQEICGLESVCTENRCRPSSCDNNRVDEGEEAIDCGGPCEPCQKCRVHGDCASGFCDSAFNDVCSKRCRHDLDCKNSDNWDGEFCRSDGRCSPKVFETEWTVTSASLDIKLPYAASASNSDICRFQILWGDEPEATLISETPFITDCNDATKIRHVYAKAGTYRVKIIGNFRYWGLFERINVDTSDSYNWVLTQHAPKLQKVLSFGPVGLSSYAFSGCSKLSELPSRDIPNANYLLDMRFFFYNNSMLDAPVGHWDTSNVGNMSAMFKRASMFNHDIASWNTSGVKNMAQMFYLASLFNKPIGSWNTSGVGNMEFMFGSASSFNQSIAAWDTSSVESMRAMFADAVAFNQKLDTWNTKKVQDMSYMFNSAISFNQSLGAWDVSSVTNMENIFATANLFNQDLNRWDTSHVINMNQAFMLARSFDQPLDKWNVSNVTKLGEMFSQALGFNQDLSAWTLNAGVKLNNIFQGSGLKEANYCKLMIAGSQWLSQRAQLGVFKSVTCP